MNEAEEKGLIEAYTGLLKKAQAAAQVAESLSRDLISWKCYPVGRFGIYSPSLEVSEEENELDPGERVFIIGIQPQHSEYGHPIFNFSTVTKMYLMVEKLKRDGSRSKRPKISFAMPLNIQIEPDL